jgi:hypothetical protein
VAGGAGQGVRAGVAWATFFRWRRLTWFNKLAWAYRAPSLFAGDIAALGVPSFSLATDERFQAGDFDGSGPTRMDGLDLLYVGAHGRLVGDDFELLLHADEWRPADGGLDGAGPRVAVFDACDLVDLANPSWKGPWEAVARPRLRLVLGFASKATVDKGATLRGAEFAERITAGQGVASAWIAAVHSQSQHGRDRPVALAFGQDAADAQAVLGADLQTILAMPPLHAPPTVEAL